MSTQSITATCGTCHFIPQFTTVTTSTQILYSSSGALLEVKIYRTSSIKFDVIDAHKAVSPRMTQSHILHSQLIG